MDVRIHDISSQGRLCGVDSAVKNKPYGYITGADTATGSEIYMVRAAPGWQGRQISSLTGPQECIKECPTETTIDPTKSAYDNMICQDDVKPKFQTHSPSG